MPLTQQVVAVTGASGLIGSNMVPFLRSQGLLVRVLSRKPTSFGAGVSSVQGDIRSSAVTEELLRGCDFAVHLAGIAHTSLNSKAAIREAEEINIGGAMNLLHAARRLAVRRVVLISSTAVYSAQQGWCLKEQSPTAADSTYASTKLAVEDAGLKVANEGSTEVVIARPCLTYGPGARGNLLSLMRAIHSRYYFHAGGCNPIRSFLSVGNAVSAINHLMLHGKNGCIYNVADKTPRSLIEFVDDMADWMGAPKPFTVPLPLLRVAISAATPLRLLGVCKSLSVEALKKLTTTSTLDTTALASTGFQWQSGEWKYQRQMVLSFLANLS